MSGEIKFVDANFLDGMLAGEGLPELSHHPEGIGSTALNPQALYFADKTPSQIAREQLMRDEQAREVERRDAARRARREAEKGESGSK